MFFVLAFLGLLVCMAGMAVMPWHWHRRWWMLAYAGFFIVLALSRTPA
jgi:cell division protein FtsW (lipid II flippase)